MQPELTDSINSFAEALMATEEFSAYDAAQKAFQQDDSVRDLLTRLNTLSHELGQKQQQDELTDEDIELYRSLKTQFTENPTVAHLQEQENKVTETFRECNHEISQELGLDFASNAAPSSCGCG